MPWTTQTATLACGQAPAVLEFPELLEDLARRAHLPRSAETLRALAPLADAVGLMARRERVAAWQRLLELGEEPDLSGLADPGPRLEASRRAGAALGGAELADLARCLRAIDRCGDFLRHHAGEAPVLAADWGDPPSLAPVAGAIERCLDVEGNLLDGASPLLGRLRAQVRSTRQQVRDTLDGLIRGKLGGPGEDPRPRLRDGRLVLPVRREQRSTLPGIVHDESGTGRTLFVEPLETVELNNRVTSLLADEAKEARRILAELTARVGAHAEIIRGRLEAFHDLDVALAVARSCRGDGWRWAERAEAGGLRLAAARHPLLARYLPPGQELVPLDLELDPALRLLLVTGPNTGGKTVLLKTLGLLVLMNQCGLPVPARDGTRLPLFDHLFVDIGDEQSLQDSRSTFSAHLEHLVGMVDGAGAGSLILVDEICDGTDPEEGAALARAIMQRWLDREALAVITTHIGVLKGFAQETPGAANAAMEFDAVARRPLYSLRFGVPGSSRALATARRLGMDGGVLAAAEELLGDEALSLEGLLERLERETGRAEAARRHAEELERRHGALREEYEQRLAGARREAKELLDRARRDGEEFLAGARSELERVVREIREAGAGREAILGGREALSRLGEEAAELGGPAPPAEPLRAWRAGDRVRLRVTGQAAEILGEAGEDRVRVAVGDLTLVLPLADLLPAPPPAGRPRPEPVDVGYEAAEPDSYRLDLRGLTVEEARARLDDFLDGASLAGFDFVEILHGKGTGALRQAVRDLLARDRRVRGQRLADQGRGGSGVTVARLAADGGGDEQTEG